MTQVIAATALIAATVIVLSPLSLPLSSARTPFSPLLFKVVETFSVVLGTFSVSGVAGVFTVSTGICEVILPVGDVGGAAVFVRFVVGSITGVVGASVVAASVVVSAVVVRAVVVGAVVGGAVVVGAVVIAVVVVEGIVGVVGGVAVVVAGCVVGGVTSSEK